MCIRDSPQALLLLLLEQHFLGLAQLRLQKRLLGGAGRLYHAVAAVLLLPRRHLARHVVSAGARAAGVGEHVHFGESDFSDKGEACLELLLRLPGKAHHHVRGDGAALSLIHI